jgi:thioredoxin reductase (NADPH)
MPEDSCDVAIIGRGPAGLQAAIHAASKKAKVMVFGKLQKSGLYKARIANFCCSEKIIPGKQMLEAGRKQAESFDAVFLEEDVMETKSENDGFVLVTEGGKAFRTKALILAMGVARKKLRVKGEKEFVGRGVSYCVDCDANFFKGMDVAVVGNESAAAAGALTLLQYAKRVFVVCRELITTDVLRKQLENSEVEIIRDTWVKEIMGGSEVEGVTLKNGQTLNVSGVFVELGAKGAMELAANLGVVFDAETFSFIETNKKQETNIQGVYAAGDITGRPLQIAKAVGEGCVAGIEAAEYAKKLGNS